MKGTNPAGQAASKGRPDAKEFKALLDDEVARDLRRAMHRVLREAGYSAEQIRQIAGWPVRTVRRDLAVAGPSFDRRSDPRRAPGAAARPADPRDPRSDPRRPLTPREVRSLREDYGSGPLATPEVRAFLATLQADAAV